MKIITVVGLALSSTWTFAETSTETQKKYQEAIQQLSQQKINVKSVNDTPINDIKEVVVSSGTTNQIIYISKDGDYMFDGNLLSLSQRKNLTEMSQNSLRHDLIETFKKDHKAIDFLPENMTDHVTVFTDIDCGYCRKLHQEVESYNALGIGVSYLFFPRSGLNSSSHQKAVNVWCSSDQKKALTMAKNGEELEPLMCPNPIESQYELGIGADIHKLGTPTVVLNNGSVIRGYLPADKMKQRIEQLKTQ